MQVLIIDVVNEKASEMASYRGTEWNELFVGKATQPEAYGGIESTRNARGIAAYGHVAYNLGVAETNLVLRIA